MTWYDEDLEPSPRPAPFSATGMAAGLLAALPLFLAYELARSDVGLANAAERFLTLPIAAVLSAAGASDGTLPTALRVGLVVLAASWALVHVLRAGEPNFRGLVGLALRGAVCGVVLGPLLIGIGHLLGPAAPDLASAAAGPSVSPSAALVLFHAGSAAWEELLFRVLLYGLVYLLARRTVLFLSGAEGPADWVADAAALVVTALLFAGFHLAALTAWLGEGGAPFDSAVFLWQTLAGLVLGGLMRWGGFGVAAWAHAVFNLGLALGAGPEAFL